MRFPVFVLLCVLSLQGHFSHAAGFEWSSEQFIPLNADFDGDGVDDFILLSKSPGYPSQIVSLSSNSNLDNSEYWMLYQPETYSVVIGDFDNNGRAEIMVLSQQMEGFYLAVDDELGLVEGEEKLKITGYDESTQIDFTKLVRGDFNGDGSDDFLAYAEDSHDFVIFRNKNNDNKIKFQFKDQLDLNNPSSFEPMVKDFDDDGNDDIALLSTTEGGASYVAFANNNGRFKRSDFEDISSYLNDEDWSLSNFSIIRWRDPENNKETLLRISNADWDVDEEGNPIDDDGNPMNTPITRVAISPMKKMPKVVMSIVKLPRKTSGVTSLKPNSRMTP